MTRPSYFVVAGLAIEFDAERLEKFKKALLVLTPGGYLKVNVMRSDPETGRSFDCGFVWISAQDSWGILTFPPPEMPILREAFDE